jgi:hypothetical protein
MPEAFFAGNEGLFAAPNTFAKSEEVNAINRGVWVALVAFFSPGRYSSPKSPTEEKAWRPSIHTYRACNSPKV